MTEQMTRQRLVERYLDPASRLGEVLFGLIMVLSVTLTAGLTADEGPRGVHQLLLAAIGCNVAWGIIDAIMYIMNCITERAEKARIIEAIQRAPDHESALQVIRDDIEPRFEALTAPEDREALCHSILAYLGHSELPRIRATREDFYGAIACFWLVVISCLPVALPFLAFTEVTPALRVSNAILITMLFIAGHRWARYAHTNGLIAGLVMVAIGLALVGVAHLLGG